MTRKRLLLGASHSVIEPLGILHEGGLARDLGWEREYCLIHDYNFTHLEDQIKSFKPDIIGFNVYTGNHTQLFEAFKKIKKDHPHVQTVVGGPHPTYFPAEAVKNADFVVMSEGFHALELILTGKAKKGILPFIKKKEFPLPDRKKFYEYSPEHGKSKIKSFITMTGCPYRCTYCYNSTDKQDIMDGLPPEVAEQLAKDMGIGNRLFPFNGRSVDSVIEECNEIAENWPTEVLYCQDDVHGFDLKWLETLSSRWKTEVGIPYHAQMRWEMTRQTERIDMLQQAGCFGLTLAIEAADHTLRKEVLDRAMPEELIFEGMDKLIKRQFKVRTEQITGLPYGATSIKTKINLEADLELLEFNVRLKELTGGPTMAWASSLAPYARTKLGMYCEKYGHYEGNNNDVPDTFFERSVLRFPKSWVGPSLEQRKNEPGIWLPEEELELYREQNAELRRLFNFFAEMPKGYVLAKNYLKSGKNFSYERLGQETEEHLQLIEGEVARRKLADISHFRTEIEAITTSPDEREELKKLSPYFGSLPEGKRAAQRYLTYGRIRGFTPMTLSDSTRHHLYDEVLYSTTYKNPAITQRTYTPDQEEKGNKRLKV